ncbi:hypothetical protein [Marilutibacter alkalisoli]|uniref:hypothetical protein n=1 Tax=Marilutibacter alkalisoli TaxID=2591633 RepID=UPI001421EE05|nr:hypothetical protein [Lysobacter alkalisoli]
MKGRNALKMVTVLAVISAIGIIGMLLVDGMAETFLLPLGICLWRWRVESGKAVQVKAR